MANEDKKLKEYKPGKDLSIVPRDLTNRDGGCLEIKYSNDGRTVIKMIKKTFVRNPIRGNLEGIMHITGDKKDNYNLIVQGTDERGDNYTREIPFNKIDTFYCP